MRRVLVLSPSTWDLDELAKPKYRGHYEPVYFETGFYETPLLLAGLTFDIRDSIARAIAAGRAARVDGVIGTHDYPASLEAAAVAAGLGLPGPPVDRALVCHHKYLCREVQQRVAPEATPAFGLIDPFDFSPWSLPLAFPFFVKPVKGTLSVRAGRADDYAALIGILNLSFLERSVGRLVMRPFNQMLADYTDFGTSGNAFIAEGVLDGTCQVTVEGFVDEGRVEIMGIVDSVMYPGTISFERFEYPTRLPCGVQARMRALAVRTVEATGFWHGCFNVEMMYDADADTIGIIEMNPRLCSQFSDLYEKVDGTSGYDVQLALATGRRPTFRAGHGPCRVAASFVLRVFEDRLVVRLPDRRGLDEIQRRFPGVVVKLLCREGQWLSQQPQDMTSYRYAIVNLGGDSFEELDVAYDELRRHLPVQFEGSASRRNLRPSFRA